MTFRLGLERWVDFENWKGEGRAFSKAERVTDTEVRTNLLEEGARNQPDWRRWDMEGMIENNIEYKE